MVDSAAREPSNLAIVHEKYIKAANEIAHMGYTLNKALRNHVYLASNHAQGRVIIKFASSLPSRYGLKQSAEFLSQNPSDYWPEVIEYGSSHHIDWLITPYIEGRTLCSMINKEDPNKKAFECDPVFSWLSTLETAVNTLHQCGHVHGDIKPSNVLIDRNQNIHLIDFDSVTAIGTVLESLPYSFISPNFAPNVKKNPTTSVTTQTDWYSVATTLEAILARFSNSTSGLPSRYQVILRNH
ncbi:protein kinase [uncultured Vibrio sp.]|uniref:protein kinase domain-containing protein n=1 Tax=uncultured Vibrio sp. TaxID=114054 RepID=UPI00091675A4|nr:protein kinase [uncultured Vibrio sp.]OIQ26210.1 MAG: hypothetical protein BM561_00135 [Vibrio sp. MedPE-SWchi]